MEAELRVRQVLAGQDGGPLEEVGLPLLVLQHHLVGAGGLNLGAYRDDVMKGELGRLADYVEQLLAGAEARHLDQDAALALPLDHRLARAGLVDAPAHDFQRLGHDAIGDLGPAGL